SDLGDHFKSGQRLTVGVSPRHDYSLLSRSLLITRWNPYERFLAEPLSLRRPPRRVGLHARHAQQLSTLFLVGSCVKSFRIMPACSGAGLMPFAESSRH